MSSLKLLFVIVLCGFSLQAQNFKYGKVSKAELSQVSHPIDSGAVASVLYRSEHISFRYDDVYGFIQERDIYTRIKIYANAGFEYATEKVYLFQSKGDVERVEGLKAATYNLVDGNIEKEKISKASIFKEDYNENYKVTSFTMPNVKVGSVIEYRYKIKSPFKVIDDVNFQAKIPINQLSVRISIPDFYQFEPKYNYKASFVPKPKKTLELQTIPFEYRTNVLEFKEQDIIAIQDEPYAGNVNNFKAKLGFELSAIKDYNGVVKKSFTGTWDDVCKSIFNSYSFGTQIDRSGFLKRDIQQLCAGETTEEAKLQLIYAHLLSKVKWNGNQGVYTQQGIRKAYQDGTGNVADVNLLLVAMLRSQGLLAYPVLVSTLDHGIPMFPTINGFNYVVCLVKAGENEYLVDATDLVTPIGMLPQRAINWKGRLVIDEETSTWVSLKANVVSNELNSLNILIDEELSITGKSLVKKEAYAARDYRTRFFNVGDDAHIKSLESSDADLHISNFSFNRAEYGLVKVSYDFELPEALDLTGDQVYFNPLFYLADDEHPFKLNTRQFPIDFLYKSKKKTVVNIKLPEGYQVEYLPSSESISYEGGIKFTYKIQESPGYLRLNVSYEILETYFLPDSYQSLKEYFNKIIDKQKEMVILKQVAP